MLVLMEIEIFPKKCPACKQNFPADTAFFYKNTANKDGLSQYCKICEAVRSQTCAAVHQKSDRLTVEGYLFGVYYDIKQKCCDPDNAAFHRYGKKGVRCLFQSADEFADFVINVLEEDPRGFYCDRIDRDNDYEPGNIRFIIR